VLHIVLAAPPVFVDMRFADALVIHLFFIYFFFAGDISETSEPVFTKSSRKMAKWATIEKLTFWFLNSFGGGWRFKKVTFTSDPASQNAILRR